MALSELWRFDAPPQARLKVTRDGFGVLLRQPSTCGATLYAFAPKVPQQLPLRSDARGMERGEVSWSTDGKYLASTGLEGKLQLLRKEENGYVEVALLEHGFRRMPQLCWSPSVQHLALWQRQERSWRLWRGSDGLQTLEETFSVKGIAWCPHWPLLAVWYCFGDASKSLHLWSTESLQEVHLTFGRQVCDVAWSPHWDTDAATAAAVLQDGQVILWSARTEEMQLETSVLQKLPQFAQPSVDSWEVQWSPEGTGTARLVLQPWRNLRVSGAVHNNAVAELHFTVTPKNAQEKVLPAGSLAAWPSPKIWRQQWTEIALEGFTLTIHGWSPDGRCLLVVAHALSAAVGHVKRCRAQLWSTEGADAPVVPVMEISTLEDCPLHRLRVMEGGLLGAAVDGTARLISLEESAPQHIILGDAWNAAAPTGASWRNWPRGAIDACILPCHRIAVTLRHRQMAGDCEEGDAVVVFGRHFEGSNYRRLLMGRNMEADLPRDEDAALKSLGCFLSHLELDATSLDLARQQAARYLDRVQSMLGELSPAFKSQVEAAAAWCSPEDPSLQWLINNAVEADDGDLLKSLVHFFLSLHAWHHALRSPLLPPAPWEEGRLCCVAEALDQSWRPFMREGSTYRLPTFTSLAPIRTVAAPTEDPEDPEDQDGVPQTHWYLDVEGTSVNDTSLLYIDAELAGGGGIWILPPYCVVEVVSAKLTDGGVDYITLRLPGDSVSRMDLPIGPPMHRLSLDARAEAEGGNRW